MRPTIPLFLSFLGVALAGPGHAQAEMSPQSGLLLRNLAASQAQSPGLICRQAIRGAERAANIPTQLMAAIARIENGRPDGQGGVHPWPWTINAEGEGHSYPTKAAAIAAAQAMQARGVRSMDVGCMQVNLMHHPNAFAALDQAFDLEANATYAAQFLNQHFVRTGDWAKATANYHSATPDIGADYERKVANVLPDEQRRLAELPGADTGNVWSTNVWSTNMWNARGATWPGRTGTPGSTGQPAGRPAGPQARSVAAICCRTRPAAARILSAPLGTVGRALAAYRAAPIPLASRQPALASLLPTR